MSYKYVLSVLLFVSCKENLNSTAIKPDNKKAIISLLPFNGFDTTQLSLIQLEVEDFYHCKCIVLHQTKIPSFSFFAPRNRYKADSLLLFEKNFSTEDNNIVVGFNQ